MQGYIKLHRKIIEWEWYQDTNTFRLFVHLLLKANHTDKKWRGLEIKRGSFITSYDSLSKECGLSYRQIRTSLSKLKETGEVTVKTTNKYSQISITYYNKYQDNDSPTVSQKAVKRQSNDSQATTTKNDKNVNNENKLEEFRKWKWREDKTFQAWREDKGYLPSLVDRKKEDVILHCESKGAHYKNYKAALQKFLNTEGVKR